MFHKAAEKPQRTVLSTSTDRSAEHSGKFSTVSTEFSTIIAHPVEKEGNKRDFTKQMRKRSFEK